MNKGTTPRVILPFLIVLASFLSSVPAPARCARATAHSPVSRRPASPGVTTRISTAWDGVEPARRFLYPSISADGRYIAFESQFAGGYHENVATYDQWGGMTESLPIDSDVLPEGCPPVGPDLSADGQHLAFVCGGDVFAWDRQTGTIERIPISPQGEPGNDVSWLPTISGEGRHVAFLSLASNLAGPTGIWGDAFVRDRHETWVERVSVSSTGEQADVYSYDVSISADGRYAVWASGARNLDPEDTNLQMDVWVRDRLSQTTERVSLASDGTQGNQGSQEGVISADGRYVAFTSWASNLVPGDTNNALDVFVHDRQSGATWRVSVASDGSQANGGSYAPSISGDGQYVAFESRATNLAPGDDVRPDVFVHDRQTAITERVSVASDGTPGDQGGIQPSISADGRYVAFASSSTNLVLGDWNGEFDVFVRDREGTFGGATISGRVLDTAGNSLAGVSVSAGYGYMTTTGADGRYELALPVNGTVNVTASKEGYNLLPANRTVTVPPDASGQDFTAYYFPALLADEISRFSTDSCSSLQSVAGTANDVAAVGDFFLDEAGADAVRTVVDVTVNSISLLSGLGDVGGALDDVAGQVTLPGYRQLAGGSWEGWVVGSDAASHWYKPLYDAIAGRADLTLDANFWAGFAYFYGGDTASTVGKEAIEGWLVDSLVPGPGSPLATFFGEPAADLADDYCAQLQRERDEVLDAIAFVGLTPQQEQSYVADLQARQVAHSQILDQVQALRDLMWSSYQDALQDESQWWNFWSGLLLKWAIVGSATIMWDGAGYAVASVAVDAYELLHDVLVGVQSLAHDAKMLDQALRFLTGQTSSAYTRMSLNTVGAFYEIRTRTPPQPAGAEIGSVALKSLGHFRLWPGLWWAEETSHAEIPLTNNMSYATTYLTWTSYSHTGQWRGVEQIAAGGESPHLEQGQQHTARIQFKGTNDGLSPDESSDVEIVVMGATDTGLYPVAAFTTPWLPERIEVSRGARAEPPAGYTMADVTNAPTHPFPLATLVTTSPGSMAHQVIIAVENPFEFDLSATVTQTVPAEFGLLDDDDGSMIGQALVWTMPLTAGASIELRPLLAWDGQPGATTALPGAELAFWDPHSDTGDVYEAPDLEVNAPWPIEVAAHVPLSYSMGVQTPTPVEIRSLNANATVNGELVARVSTIDGRELWSDTRTLFLPPLWTSTHYLQVRIDEPTDYVVVTGQIRIGSESRDVFQEIVPLVGTRLYLPLVIKALY